MAVAHRPIRRKETRPRLPALHRRSAHDPSDVEALKAQVDLAEIIRQSGVPLEKVGNALQGRCPFHKDSKASLSVNAKRQLWKCFGCQSGGDVLTFLQMKEGLSFPEALQRLEGSAAPPRRLYRRPPREPGDTATPNDDNLPGHLSRGELLGRVAELYAQRLRESRPAQEYLASRGLGAREIWDAFGIGFSDGSLMKTIPEAGALRDALARVGVINRRGGEHFAGCVVIPLRHPDQGVVGLYGRKIAPDRVPHLYLPGPQRGVLNWEALKGSPAVWIAESVLDAISLWAAGCRDATALFGVQRIPPDLEEALVRFGVREVRFALDGDDAGREAAVRLSAPLAARGVRCFAVELPEGQDPNLVLVEEGPAALAERVRSWKPLQEEDAQAGAVIREKTGDGFVLDCGAVSYRVTPHPPFGSRLRAQVRAMRDGRTCIDTLDLFAHRARATMTVQICRQLELARDAVERHFLLIIEEAERWAAEAAQQAQGDADAFVVQEPPPMSEAERAEALAFLRRPDLAQAVVDDMERFGYVGEERAKLLAYLIGVSRKLEKPLSGIVLSQSGAGKSTMTDAVESLVPPEDVVLFARLSAQALAYMPRDYLVHRLVILEERIGGEAADYQIRVLQSRRHFCSAVVMKDPTTGRMQTKRVEVDGPIAYLETTTNPDINHENATRCFELGLDESEAQTQRIHDRQRRSRTLEGVAQTERAEDERRRHHNAQRLLESVRVVIPYVERLSFPSRWLRTRRDNERFLCLVEAVAFLHQHQRRSGSYTVGEKTFRWVEATVADYRLAWELAQDMLGATLHELSRDAQELLAHIQAHVAELQGGKKEAAVLFTRRALRDRTGWHDKRLRQVLQEMVDMEYLAAVSGSQGRTFHYRLLAADEGAAAILSGLTTPDELERMLAAGGG